MSHLPKTKRDAAEALRRKIRGIEEAAAPEQPRLPLGVPSIDRALPGGGLRLGCIHEVAGGRSRHRFLRGPARARLGHRVTRRPPPRCAPLARPGQRPVRARPGPLWNRPRSAAGRFATPPPKRHAVGHGGNAPLPRRDGGRRRDRDGRSRGRAPPDARRRGNADAGTGAVARRRGAGVVWRAGAAWWRGAPARWQAAGARWSGRAWRGQPLARHLRPARR